MTCRTGITAQRLDGSWRPNAWLPWFVLGATLSPVWIDLVQHIGREPWAGYVLVLAGFAARSILAADRLEADRLAVGVGFALLVVGLALEIFAVASRAPRIARPAIPLAVIGLCQLLGTAPLRASLSALWVVPIPMIVMVQASPGLETAMLRAAAWLLAPFAGEFAVQGVEVSWGGAAMELLPSHTGGPVAALLAGLAWNRRLDCGGSLGRAARDAAIWALAALPIQMLAMVASLLLLRAGSAVALQVLIWTWLPVALVGIALRARGATTAAGSYGESR